MDILKLNPISNLVNEVLGNNYTVTDTAEAPVGVLVRSFDMHEYNLPSSVIAVARAGAGVTTTSTSASTPSKIATATSVANSNTSIISQCLHPSSNPRRVLLFRDRMVIFV